MSFADFVESYSSFDVPARLSRVTVAEVESSLQGEVLEPHDLINLLSPQAAAYLEPMARKAQALTRRNFGRTIGLYAPLYISDYCTNHCTYCGFNQTSHFERHKLTPEQIEEEADALARTGVQHVLVLTGEAPQITPMTYLLEAVEVLKGYFSSIAIEMFPMDVDDYRRLHQAGVDSLTVYQETYDHRVYLEVHPRGKKRDYRYRLLTPERGAEAGFRAINIGALFGLSETRTEALMVGLHAKYLEQAWPEVEISISLPRMNRAEGCIEPRYPLSDRDFVQFMLAWRLFMPRLGITISTREAADFRDHLINLGATRFSVASKTNVGGYAVYPDCSTPQFDITDRRSADEVIAMIRRSGYQPVFKDWQRCC